MRGIYHGLGSWIFMSARTAYNRSFFTPPGFFVLPNGTDNTKSDIKKEHKESQSYYQEL